MLAEVEDLTGTLVSPLRRLIPLQARVSLTSLETSESSPRLWSGSRETCRERRKKSERVHNTEMKSYSNSTAWKTINLKSIVRINHTFGGTNSMLPLTVFRPSFGAVLRR